jgi:hypothetical protein
MVIEHWRDVKLTRVLSMCNGHSHLDGKEDRVTSGGFKHSRWK